MVFNQQQGGGGAAAVFDTAGAVVATELVVPVFDPHTRLQARLGTSDIEHVGGAQQGFGFGFVAKTIIALMWTEKYLQGQWQAPAPKK